MAKQLNAEQKTIGELLGKHNVKFLIPDYQRPYSWEFEQCETLWEDIYAFAFPVDHKFDADKDRYFLGTILTFQNKAYENEIIDGQQRLVTFLLLLRAFYTAIESVDCANKKNILSSIGQCIWKTDEFDNVDKTSLKLKSKVSSDDDTAEFQKILETGEVTKDNTSNYAENYRYFQKVIAKFKDNKPTDFPYLPMRILKNCILLPIETDDQNTAFRIFTTLNDRGMPLSDADLFKAQFYKFYLMKHGDSAKDKFVSRWKDLTELCNRNFYPRKGTPLDDLFMRYMYYLLAKSGTKNDTFVDMRDYYERDGYKVLQSEAVFEDLIALANFWNDVAKRNEKFSMPVLKRLYVLSYAPYSIWAYIVSLYFMGNRELDKDKFYKFLDKITALLLLHAITNPGTHSIRRPFFMEFQNILHGLPLEFKQSIMEEKFFRAVLRNTKFSPTRPITRSILAWWTFHFDAQELPPLDTRLEVEHIYAKNRHKNFEPLNNPDTLEFLGNKALLEKRINIAATCYRLADKKKFYLGDGEKAGTFNLELRGLAQTHDDFTEADIIERNEEIFDAFIEYLRGNDLLF